MNLRSLLLLASLGLLASGALPAADYVQIATHSPGVAGSLWESDLEIRADGGVPADVVVDLLGKDRDNTTPLATTYVNLPAGVSLGLTDLIEDTFGLTFTTGALRMTTLNGLPSYHSRTRNVGAWTFAYDVPISGSAAVIPSGAIGRVIHLTGTADQRSNLGYVNVTATTTTVDVSLHRPDGTLYDSFSIVLAPHDMRLTSNLFPTQDVPDGYAVLSSATPGSAFLAHGMVVDTSSGEWIMVPAAVEGTFPAEGFGPEVLYLPLAQRSVDGQDTTAWTELEVSTGPNQGVSARLDLLASNQDNSSPEWATLDVPADFTGRVTDLLGVWVPANGTGAVRMTITAGWLLAADSIAYDATTGSTWGRHIPMVDPASAFGGGGHSGMVLQLHRDGDTDSDLGIVNLGPVSADFDVTQIASDGRALGHSHATLLPWEHRELQSIFAPYGTVSDGAALVVSGAQFLCYGSVVEISSGDAGYQAGTASPVMFLDGFEDGTTDGWLAVN